MIACIDPYFISGFLCYIIMMPNLSRCLELCHVMRLHFASLKNCHKKDIESSCIPLGHIDAGIGQLAISILPHKMQEITTSTCIDVIRHTLESQVP
jgi:hypothetical protein